MSEEDTPTTSKEDSEPETPVLESIEEPSEPITRKDPKRVEQGKKLALISKEAKERKMRERIERENFSYLTTYGYPLMTFVSILGVAWMMVFGNSNVRPDDVVLPEEVLRPVSRSRGRTRREDPPDEPPRSNFVSFD